MSWNIGTLKRLAQVSIIGTSFVFGLGTVNAQNPYWYDHGDSAKRHQKAEKRELKLHQRMEREEFGNSKELKRHQKEEQRELKRHQKREKRLYDRDRSWRP